MAKVDLIMPKMGESIMEATILRWVKKTGDWVEADETILEIATDKVDSEVPSPVSGKLATVLFPENEVVQVGKAIAVIDTEAGESIQLASDVAVGVVSPEAPVLAAAVEVTVAAALETVTISRPLPESVDGRGEEGRFYSPLVRNIARSENIGPAELDSIPGTGQGGRVTKKDILDYIGRRDKETTSAPVGANVLESPGPDVLARPSASVSGGTDILEMDRMRRLIADHMVMSKRVSPHVTSFVEVDVTPLVQWRERNKESFQRKYGEKITFTPLFIEAVARAIGDFPMINVSVEEHRILVKKDVNIGMATALPSGNLIVPVIRNANFLSLPGLTRAVNDLADRARQNKLKPEEIQGGTFTLTNVGTFGNVMGTPIINQPQVAILATGAIRKKPAVVETPYGDLIAVRQLMFLSLSYDHRVVDGALGGSFLRRVGDYLEAFDPERVI
ncbi:MAG: catalytic domain of component of various dehydrogenase complexe [Bacteroidota bacterium]|jgi:2-oxoglutarate dehydrogenase E2 component (dihydrolipoamide succinyltransferase)